METWNACGPGAAPFEMAEQSAFKFQLRLAEIPPSIDLLPSAWPTSTPPLYNLPADRRKTVQPSTKTGVRGGAAPSVAHPARYGREPCRVGTGSQQEPDQGASAVVSVGVPQKQSSLPMKFYASATYN
jgi:hypothetical protein